MTIDTLESVWAPRLLSVLRFVAALLFFEHGSSKLFGFPPSDHSGAAFLTLPWFAGVLELVGGALLIPGIFTRCVAFILSGEMAVGYWMVHAPKSFYPVINGGDAAILYCFVFLYLAAAGGGPWSVDALSRRKT
jgi:putative oxidoreductase